MSRRFPTQRDIDTFLREPRLALLLYHGGRPAPTGVPVWFDWDGETVRMFSGRTSPKVEHLKKNPNVSVLVTNRVGEPEGWVAFDGEVEISDFEVDDWTRLIDQVAPRYWDLEDPEKAEVIAQWRSAPEAFVSLRLLPTATRSGS